MIIVGYQGIGKSTLGTTKGFIDLESSCMRLDTGERPDNWYEYYCNFAEHLSKDGKIVFTSSHKVVRDRFKKSKEKVFLCYPSATLKDGWISRLEERYNQSRLAKDFRAWQNALDCYDQNIFDLESEDFDKIIITTMDYNLEELINSKLEL